MALRRRSLLESSLLTGDGGASGSAVARPTGGGTAVPRTRTGPTRRGPVIEDPPPVPPDEPTTPAPPSTPTARTDVRTNVYEPVGEDRLTNVNFKSPKDSILSILRYYDYNELPQALADIQAGAYGPERQKFFEGWSAEGDKLLYPRGKTLAPEFGDPLDYNDIDVIAAYDRGTGGAKGWYWGIDPARDAAKRAAGGSPSGVSGSAAPTASSLISQAFAPASAFAPGVPNLMGDLWGDPPEDSRTSIEDLIGEPRPPTPELDGLFGDPQAAGPTTLDRPSAAGTSGAAAGGRTGVADAPSAAAAAGPGAVGGGAGIEEIIRQILSGRGALGSDLERSTTDAIQSIIQQGGALNEGRLNTRIEGARERLERARRGQTEQAQAELAARGLVSQPGIQQGAEKTAIGEISETLGEDFSTALRDIEVAESQAADERLISALGLAAGMTRDQAQTLLGAVGAENQRQAILAEIAMETLKTNTTWNMFLAQYGLDRDRLMFDLANGRMEEILPILSMFLQTLNSARGGSA